MGSNSSSADGVAAPPKPLQIVRPCLNAEELELRAHAQHVAGVRIAAIGARKAAEKVAEKEAAEARKVAEKAAARAAQLEAAARRKLEE
eukprot:1410085-Pleurochrysis_carterae.AAC.1